MSPAPDPSALLSLEGRVALVTGASGGIGSAVAESLRAAGAEVACVDLERAGASAEAESLACDVSDPAAVERMFERFGKRFDRLDVLVHCAGITRDAVLWKMDHDAWTGVLRTNLDSAYLLLRHAVPLMRAAGGGSVVLISSINAERGKLGQANYAASKAGLIGLGRTAARETGRFGIRVNVVSPGMIDTAMTASLPDEIKARARQESALGKIGRVEDVAQAGLFLASPMSDHVTGQVLRVDGGQLMA
ncbi:MAG: SDR family oxidoreductase [bacterium]|nr:SDR family oxidoreductase [bacterium]